MICEKNIHISRNINKIKSYKLSLMCFKLVVHHIAAKLDNHILGMKTYSLDTCSLDLVGIL